MENIINNENIVEVQDVTTTSDTVIESVDVNTTDTVSANNINRIDWKTLMWFGGGYVVGKYGGKAVRWVTGKIMKACLPTVPVPVAQSDAQPATKTVVNETPGRGSKSQETKPDKEAKTAPAVEPEVIKEDVQDSATK